MLVALSEGTYTLDVAMREDGAALDDFILDPTGAFDGADAMAALIPFTTVATCGPSDIVADCNFNRIPDNCDVANGTSADGVGPGGLPDGTPDECQTDCNGNLVPDDLDLAAGTSSDCDGNGVLDECQCVAIDVAARVADVGTAVVRGFDVAFLEGVGRTGPDMRIASNFLDLFPPTGTGTFSVINFELNGNNAGVIPGDVPTLTTATTNISMRARTFLEVLAAGCHGLSFNTDDGFSAWIGQQKVAEFRRGRGAATTTVFVFFPAPGLYPLQVDWTQGGGGASVEVFECVNAVNDPANVGLALINDDAAHPDVLRAYVDGPAFDWPAGVPTVGVAERIADVGTSAVRGFDVDWLTDAGPTGANINTACTLLELNTPTLETIEPVINFVDNFNDGVISPSAPFPLFGTIGIDHDDFSMRARTFLEVTVAGLVVFAVDSDDGYRVWIGDMIVSEWITGRGPATTTFGVFFDTPGIYPLQLDWTEGRGGAEVEFFQWMNFAADPATATPVLINDTATDPNVLRVFVDGPPVIWPACP